jgi:3-oxoacyl-[acyl-carrier protein] reductase
MSRLADRHALVTGATGVLGRTIAEAFWSEGANLVLVGRSPDELARLRTSLSASVGQTSTVIVEDLADPAAPGRIVARAQELVPRLDVLVNTAAEQGPVGCVWENDWAAWERTVRVNLLAPAALCRLAAAWMRRPADGLRAKIVNVSGGGATAPRPRFSAYATAKAGLVRFSETLAEEVGPWGIDVNCVAPGAMFSAMTEAVLAAGPASAGAREYAQAERSREEGRRAAGRAESLCLFLASPASDGITGKLLAAVWDPWETLADHREDLEGTDVYTLRRIVPGDRGLKWGER